jgi:hypothetical protein
MNTTGKHACTNMDKDSLQRHYAYVPQHCAMNMSKRMTLPVRESDCTLAPICSTIPQRRMPLAWALGQPTPIIIIRGKCDFRPKSHASPAAIYFRLFDSCHFYCCLWLPARSYRGPTGLDEGRLFAFAEQKPDLSESQGDTGRCSCFGHCA